MIELWCDGGTGPGNGTAATKCYGSFQINDGKPRRRKFADGLTNNEAEYLALIEGLKDRRLTGPGSKWVTVHSDSQLMVRQMIGTYRIKEPRLAELAREARRLIARRSLQITFEWVPREQIMARLGH